MKQLPSRLHHNAYVAKNLELTRRFYEDMMGMPLLATWNRWLNRPSRQFLITAA